MEFRYNLFQCVVSQLAFVDDDDEIDQDVNVNATIKLDSSCSNVDGSSLNDTSIHTSPHAFIAAQATIPDIENISASMSAEGNKISSGQGKVNSDGGGNDPDEEMRTWEEQIAQRARVCAATTQPNPV